MCPDVMLYCGLEGCVLTIIVESLGGVYTVCVGFSDMNYCLRDV